MKGGIWKNSEDEILKAAIMKYGKNQWARVASLLPRKTAKQCKARWYEWLDPSIKKTEWSREEEERLLHLAKLYPAQWRTISPLVGRTAGQCLEHYEKLLDMAQDKELMDARDDPRRLQPGEIDPAPETRPARPDPVDMDEDEKEMLSEARARLANTRGKKAKRKAREKQLEEAKRLASLQKRRELVAAGIEVTRRKVRKNKGIDYATEIPFQKPVPAGVFDVSEERKRQELEKESAGFTIKRLNEVEEKRRDEEEKRLRARDKRRMKKLTAMNLPLAVASTAALNDPLLARKRTKLALPAPQVSDAELAEIAKGGALAVELGIEDESSATKALVGVYGVTPLTGAAPARTPRVPASQDIIMEEARNILALNSVGTPLKGGQNVAIVGGTGFLGAQPISRTVSTPNPMAAAATPLGTPGATPLMRGGTGLLPAGTPLRDELRINADASGALILTGSGSSRVDRMRQKALQSKLRASLLSLPEPQYTYEIEVPDLEPEPEEPKSDVFPEDAGDVLRRSEEERAAAEAAEFARRSTALKREPALPRPLVVDEEAIESVVEETGDAALGEALIREEIARLLRHDLAKYPIKAKGYKRPRGVTTIEKYTDEELEAARSLLATEEVKVKEEMRSKLGGEVSADQWGRVWLECRDSFLYVPNLKRFAHKKDIGEGQVIDSLKHTFGAVQAQLAKELKKVEKAEAKLTLVTAGFEKRCASGVEALQRKAAERDEKFILLACYRRLQADEMSALPQRLSTATAELQDATEREKELQDSYAHLLEELDDARSGRVRAPTAAPATGGDMEDA